MTLAGPSVLAYRVRALRVPWHAHCAAPPAQKPPQIAPPFGPELARRGALALGAAVAMASAAARAAPDPATIPAPVATLDPAKCRVGGLEYNCIIAVFSHLTRYDAQQVMMPDLATNWEPPADLNSWTFHLRTGMPLREWYAASRHETAQLIPSYPANAGADVLIKNDRFSAKHQKIDLQRDAPAQLGCHVVFEEGTSGAGADHPGLRSFLYRIPVSRRESSGRHGFRLLTIA